jgi:cell division transport system permease protein
MSFSTKRYYLRETFKSLKRNSLMSIASVSTVALSILVLGLFLTMVLNVNNLAQYLESQVQVTVYMEDSATAVQRRQVEQQLKMTPGVMEVKGVTKEEALANFKKRLREQQKLLDALGEENPFPYSFEIQVDKPERIQQIVPKIEQMPGVETAKFGQEVVEHIFQLTRILRIGGILLIVLLAIATLFIISNTIRITVFARRREVSIMKFVGATNWFIRWPFLLEGMLMGFVGALIAAVCLYNIYDAVQAKVYTTLAFFPLLPSWPFMVYLCAVLVAVGTFIGAAGSSISLRKFLDV